MNKTLRTILIALSLLLGLLLLSINQSLASFAGSFFPAAPPYVHGVLLLIELGSCIWLWRGVFGGRHHLVFPENPTEEERKQFTAELSRRLQYNANIDHSQLDPRQPEYIDRCLAQLQGLADTEIKHAAERVFLATALAQNGRIDAIVVFFTLCRLVWRISHIYNQRPHPGELLALYWAVITSTFLALSFEELDISTEITVGFSEAFHAMAPAVMSSGVPFVGTALQKFTSSAIDGAANGYLTLRTGIICRNAYTFSVSGKQRPSRASVYREAGGVLLGMANGLIDQVAKATGNLLWDLTVNTPTRTAQAVAGGVTASAEKMANAGLRFGSAVSETAVKTSKTVASTGRSVGSAIGSTAVRTHHAATAPFRWLKGKKPDTKDQ